MLEVGDSLPQVTLTDHRNEVFDTGSLLGTPFVLFFYPKDDTPGCSIEAAQFAELAPQFAARGVAIYGVSRDTAQSHCKFIEKFALPYPLLADTESVLCNACGVIVEKNMYGKKSLGIQRSTFLFDTAGRVVQRWPKVSPEGHAAAVLSSLEAIAV